MSGGGGGFVLAAETGRIGALRDKLYGVLARLFH